MDLDHTLITTLVERWRPKTHSFHLPHGEMTITLEDMEVIMGVPVDGLPVVGYTPPRTNWCELCDDWLVERWRSETHSFHWPHGEMTITLQDMEVIMGVPVDGLLVVGYTSPRTNWRELCDDWLGHRPPDRELGGNKNTAVMEDRRASCRERVFLSV